MKLIFTLSMLIALAGASTVQAQTSKAPEKAATAPKAPEKAATIPKKAPVRGCTTNAQCKKNEICCFNTLTGGFCLTPVVCAAT